MAEATHTPIPWDYVPSTEHHGPYITSEFGTTIADLYVMSNPGSWSVRNGGDSKPIHHLHEMADPNAEFIVRAVNNHTDLVEAVKAQHAAIDWLMAQLIVATRQGGASPFMPSQSPVWPTLVQGKAVLAKAEGRPDPAPAP